MKNEKKQNRKKKQTIKFSYLKTVLSETKDHEKISEYELGQTFDNLKN